MIIGEEVTEGGLFSVEKVGRGWEEGSMEGAVADE